MESLTEGAFVLVWIQQVDESIICWIQEHFTHSALDSAMIWISRAGDKGILWIFLGVLFLFFGLRKKEWMKRGISLLFCLATTALVCNLILKPWVARIRPYEVLHFSILVPPLSDYSFPSGHTSASFAAATAIYAMHHKWGIAAYVFAGLMGCSRLYLGVHFPTDVLAGAVIGTLLARVTLRIICILGERCKKEKECKEREEG